MLLIAVILDMYIRRYFTGKYELVRRRKVKPLDTTELEMEATHQQQQEEVTQETTVTDYIYSRRKQTAGALSRESFCF